MAHDESHAAEPAHKRVRLRATRLSTNPELAVGQKPEQSSTPYLPGTDEIEDRQTLHMTTPATNFAKSSLEEEEEVEDRQTLYMAAPGTGFAESLREEEEVEDRKTLYMTTPATNFAEPLREEVEVEDRKTLYMATPGSDVRAALSLGAGEQGGIEDQQTFPLPAVMRTPGGPMSGKPPVTDRPPARMLEELQTLQLPVVPARPGTSSAGELPVAPKLRTEEIERQSTRRVPQVSGALPARPHVPVKRGLAGTVQRLIGNGLARLQEPQPEGLVTRGLRIVRLEATFGLFPLFTLINAFGLIIISISYYLGQYSSHTLELAFLAGLLILFVPNMLRLLSPTPLRFERICLLCGLALSFYLVSLMTSPLQMSSFDGFLHWVTADNIFQTDHLFGNNSLLPVSPYYPGLEIVTDAISSLTGLNTFYASVPLIAVTRIVTVLSLFLFYEQITSSSRMAGIATIIYMVNPHFIFFGTIYNYETLALPLTLFAFYLLARYEHVGGEHRRVIFASWVVLMAITVTHHMTDYVTGGLLLLWVLVSFFTATARKTRIHLTTLALFGTVLAVAYAFLLNGNPVWTYLSSYFDIAFVQLGNILTGTGAARPLFTSTGAVPAPIWDRFLMLGSVALVAFALPFGLLTLWRLHRRNALPLTLGIFSVAYPVAQAFRFTSFGSEISDRSAAFLFLAVAYVLTILITHFWPTRQLNKRTIALVTGAISVVFLGGVILSAGAGFIALPGPYTVGADGRSVEPEGINAALWTLSYLGPDQRIGTDRTNQLLMSTYGEQQVVTELYDTVDVSPLFYSTQFDDSSINLLRRGNIHYLVVDMRLSTALPALGFYFVSDEPGMKTLTAPLSRDALTKFTLVPQINRFFDSGNIVIYDTGAFLSSSGS